MPYKVHEPRRHKIPRARYKVRNWPEYDRALQQRGSLTVWVTPEALAAWHPPRTGQRGRPRSYSDVAIETGRKGDDLSAEAWHAIANAAALILKLHARSATRAACHGVRDPFGLSGADTAGGQFNIRR
jgi:Transposase DDE domain